MQQPRILIQLDSDSHPSVFDAVVAIDSQVAHLLQYANVEPTNTRSLVHGAMFTRGPNQLHNTAIFIGGSNVGLGEAIGQEVKQSFFGPIRVSVMLDGNGSNTTAAAAVLCASRHVNLANTRALVLGGTGPVGQRVARLLLRQGSQVMLASRDQQRAQSVCNTLIARIGSEFATKLKPVTMGETPTEAKELQNATAIFSCGAAGVTLLSNDLLATAKEAQVAIDLNAVPPSGIEGIGVTDKAVSRGSRIDYGAIGVGGLKMRIHSEAIRTLFTRNDLFLDAEEVYNIGKNLEAQSA